MERLIQKGKPLALPSFMLLMMLASLALASCNTMAGAGEDLQSAGSAVEQKAKSSK